MRGYSSKNSIMCAVHIHTEPYTKTLQLNKLARHYYCDKNFMLDKLIHLL